MRRYSDMNVEEIGNVWSVTGLRDGYGGEEGERDEGEGGDKE